jgi:hypothetical protein
MTLTLTFGLHILKIDGHSTKIGRGASLICAGLSDKESDAIRTAGLDSARTLNSTLKFTAERSRTRQSIELRPPAALRARKAYRVA